MPVIKSARASEVLQFFRQLVAGFTRGREVLSSCSPLSEQGPDKDVPDLPFHTALGGRDAGFLGYFALKGGYSQQSVEGEG